MNAFDNANENRATVVIVMREREGKSGGGKGFLLAENRSFTLATSNFQVLFCMQPHPWDGARVQHGDRINTLAARMGTGGNNVPFVFAIQGTVIGRSDEAGPQGKGFADDGEPMFTLDRVSGHGVAMAFDSYNQSVSETSQTIRSGQAGNDHVGMIFEPKSAFEENWAQSDVKNALRAEASKSSHAVVASVVRRLTPTECERLQGFPDGWTDGQADSHRYKQMGNAVAVPVVQWIIDKIVK